MHNTFSRRTYNTHNSLMPGSGIEHDCTIPKSAGRVKKLFASSSSPPCVQEDEGDETWRTTIENFAQQHASVLQMNVIDGFIMCVFALVRKYTYLSCVSIHLRMCARTHTHNHTLALSFISIRMCLFLHESVVCVCICVCMHMCAYIFDTYL